jgi:hypothetical protein
MEELVGFLFEGVKSSEFKVGVEFESSPEAVELWIHCLMTICDSFYRR